MGIADNIKRMREDRGLTQQQLAENLGNNRSNISQWETGFTEPKRTVRNRLVKIFDCTASELYKERS